MKDLLCLSELKEGKFLLAFSGGPDSVYLLYRLSLLYKEKLNERIALCYIDYHDSPYVDKEEEIVKFYVDKYQLKLYKDDVHYDAIKDHNFEEWAREYRYDLFSKIIKENEYKALLTAHQKTDDAETYLLQKKRNNYPLHYGLNTVTSLKGMTVLRPLLSISKKELTDELDENHLPYYDDITNNDIRKERNRFRKELKEEKIDSIITRLNDANNRLEKLYNLFENYQNGMDFSFFDSLKEEEKQRYCFYLLDSHSIKKRREGIGKGMLDFLRRKGNKEFRIDDSLTLYRTKDEFFLSIPFEKLSYEYQIKEPCLIDNEYFQADLNDISSFNIKGFPITIRNYKEGDIISTNLGIKEASLFLRKQDVPLYLYPLYPVFVKDDKIFYIPFYQDIKKNKIPFKLNYQKGIIK